MSWRVRLLGLAGGVAFGWWTLVQQHVDRIGAAVASATPGSYVEVEIPFEANNQSGSIHVCDRPCDGPQVVV